MLIIIIVTLSSLYNVHACSASSCVILSHGAWVPLLPRAVRSRGRVIGVCVCVCGHKNELLERTNFHGLL